MWVFRRIFLTLLCATIGLTANAAFAQLSSASRHDAQDQADQTDAERARIAALYDPTEMAQAMELGSGSVRGTMGISDKQGLSGFLSRMLRGKSVALADREWVTVLPMTAHVQAWFAANNQDTRSLTGKPVGGLNPDIWKYAGRIRTDRQGQFSFDGLKPGRYLVLANFPVAYSYNRTVETGSYSYQYSYSPMFGTGSGTISPITRTERRDSEIYVWISEIVEVMPDSVTKFVPPTRDII